MNRKIWTTKNIFLLGFLIRAIFLFQGESRFIEELFLPFLDQSVRHLGQNPWALSPSHFFPYGSALYLILFIPRLLIFLFLGESGFAFPWLGHLSIKIPLLVIDFLFCLLLRSFFPIRKYWVLIFYWLNPVLIYISYIHGQLDIVAVFWATLGIYLLRKEKIALSAMALALGLLSKFQVLLVLPLFLVFIWNRNFRGPAIKQITIWLATFSCIVFIGFAPLVFAGKILYASTTSPEAMRVFAARLDLGSGASLLLGALAVLIVLGRILLSTRISSRSLFWSFGIIMGTLLMAVNPAEGWYFWVLPFLCVFVAIQNNFPKVVFFLFIFAYFAHFAWVPRLLLYLNVEDKHFVIQGLSLTVLQGLLLAQLLGIWILSLSHDIPLENRSRPFLVGLSGDSGSGKNHFSELLRNVFGSKQTVIVHGDDYHRWERGHDQWANYTHLNPKANSLLELSRNVKSLERGFPVLKSHYDHNIGKFTDPIEVKPSRTVIVQGLHSLYPRDLRNTFDIRIFLKPDPLVRLAWKLQRDQLERGYTPEKVLESIQKRSSDSQLHIEPQENFADWIITFSPVETITEEEILKGEQPRLKVTCTIWNEAPVLDLVEELNQLSSLQVKMELIPGNVDRLNLICEGRLYKTDIEKIVAKIFPNLRQITRGREPPQWKEGYDGLFQLIFLSLIKKSFD